MIEMHSSPIKKETRVVCDNCKKATELILGTADDARLSACADGWVQVGSRDICSVCKTRQVDLGPEPKP